IKLGRYAEYQEYTTAIKVRENMQVYAYYRTYTGEKSDIGYGAVNNIKKDKKPYVHIDADPYPWSWNYGADKVIVTINHSDADIVEYSEDGIVFNPYTAPFEVTENKTIYARGTNAFGVTETSLNITNIGKLTPPKPMKKLQINISVKPEPKLSSNRVEKVAVEIDYDERSTEKYYRIGTWGTLQTYTGPFEVTSSCTIYALAKGDNAQGYAVKVIDNISNGITEPVITAIPGNKVQASKVSINIEYDKYATIKRYSIDGGSLRDYTGQFEILKNGSVIYAFSQNELGQKSESTYTVQNIIPQPPTLTLDKGQYYILKLNYPLESKKREYKWKENGEWKEYKEAGILLLKPQYKDALIKNGSLIKIEDENGNLVDFTGDYYFIDVSINELNENIFMRWDREPLPAPDILITPVEPTQEVNVTIVYSSALIKKQYKIIAPDSSTSVWQNYTGTFKIDRNNTIIIANGMDDTEVWTADTMKKITNIDETQPVIKLTADLDTAAQKIAVKVNVIDDVAVGKVKWALGIQGESYFKTGGNEIPNDSIVNITANGYYTFYAEDRVGNTQVYTLNITNVDLTPPKIGISINDENTIGLYKNVTIDYGDAVTKQYKVGTNNNTWLNYTNTFEISSYTILSNNWKNSDGTVTIYAKGKDSSGNEIIVEKKIVSLDLDKPALPIINSNSTYATLYEYGVNIDARTAITYASRTDIDNYYSIDAGLTWLPYTGEFEMASGTVIAKSVKKTTGLESILSVSISMPADAIRPEAYDNNDTTFSGIGWIRIDSSMVGKKAFMHIYYANADFYAEDKTTLIQRVRLDGNYNTTVTIPENTRWMKTSSTAGGGGRLYEIYPSNEPTFTAVNKYILLHIDESKIEKQPYQMVSINYFETSVQRLYKVDGDTDWKSYNDQPIKLEVGKTIYAKGIDRNGYETRIITSHTAAISDAITNAALDGNDTTYSGVGWMEIDSTLSNQKVQMHIYYAYANFYAEDKTTLLQSVRLDGNYNTAVTIPQNARWLKTTSSAGGGGRLYEVHSSNEPTITSENKYIKLHMDESQIVKQAYQMVSINYFTTSVQRLYKIDTDTQWQNYNDKPIRLEIGQTIYAKGIDKYGNETRIISSYKAAISDAMTYAAIDGDDATASGSGWMEIDNTLISKKLFIHIYYSHLDFYASDKTTLIKRLTYDGNRTAIIDVPENSSWIKISSCRTGGGSIYEITKVDDPVITKVDEGYALLSVDPTKSINQPYEMVKIDYFPTSVQKFYKVGVDGEWLSYNNQSIKVEQGATIYAKGIDKYGNETRTVSSYTANVTDAMTEQVSDGNLDTYMSRNNSFIEVASDMFGKNIFVKFKDDYGTYIKFLDSNKNLITESYTYTAGGTKELILEVPNNTKYIQYTINRASSRLYEIKYQN
ncbi:MAG: hypothetical protein PHY91_09815, partial [Tissierellia bacterium]|nr:hypothetical protein [Tissierellia bacterium]